MTTLTPTERLDRLRANPEAENLVDLILQRYVESLESTDAPKNELLARFENPGYRGIRRESGQNFGDLMFELLERVGGKTKLFRYLMV
jgi:hypothetical protein